jgi:quercetin dioxygenase-like cupin family protein
MALGIRVCAVAMLTIIGTAFDPREQSAGNHPAGQALHHAMGNPSGAESRPATAVKPVSCEPLPHVPGKVITTAVVTFPPNAHSPAHRHPGSVTAFVLKGAIRTQLEGGKPMTYEARGTWFEPPGILHLYAENASATEPAELLAVFVADDNCGPLVVYE